LLQSAPIIAAPDWNKSFEIMCDTTDYVVSDVLGQRHNRVFHSIYYARKSIIKAQLNYTTTEKELLVVVFAFDKFRSYLVGNKVFAPYDLEHYQKRTFKHKAIEYLWDESFLYKKCKDQILIRCASEEEIP
jgi:hypothetical protein